MCLLLTLISLVSMKNTADALDFPVADGIVTDYSIAYFLL